MLSIAVLGQVPTGTTAKISVDLSIRAGADAVGRARLFAPFPVSPGSSISSTNHGQFVSGVADLTNQLKKAGLITGAQKGSIQSCAAGANIP